MKIKKIGYAFAIVLISTLAIVFSGYKYYESMIFSKQIKTAKSVYLSLPEGEANLPVIIKDVIYKVERNDEDSTNLPISVLNFVVSNVAEQDKQTRKEASWQMRKMLWERLVPKHFSEDEILALYCHYLPYEEGIGLSKSAQFHFNKDISELSVDEILMLLAIGKSPSYFSPIKNPDKAKEMQEKLFARYKSVQ